MKQQIERLCETMAEYFVKHPCTKNYGRDSGCVKGLDTPLTSQLRTFSECYDCQRKLAEEVIKENERLKAENKQLRNDYYKEGNNG